MNFEKPSKIIERFNKNLRAPSQFKPMIRNSSISDQSYLPFTYLTSSNNEETGVNRELLHAEREYERESVDRYKESNLKGGSTSAQSIPSRGSIQMGSFQSHFRNIGLSKWL